MADKKISELTNITGANIADGDELVVVDTSASETKAITFGEFKNALDTATGFVSITGDTMTGDLTVPNVVVSGNVDGRDVSADGSKLDGIEASADVTDTANVTAAGALMDSELTSEASVKALDQGVATTDSPTFAGLTTTADVSFGDNDKAIFGAGSDLEIYHDGSHSYVHDKGTGNLILRGTNMQLRGNATNELFMNCVENGRIDLYYDNAVKLATTSTGVDITGTLTSDGLTVDGTTAIPVVIDSNQTDTAIQFKNSGYDDAFIEYNDNNLFFYTDNKRFLSLASNGDISFYEDTGTTAKFFWDASAESLGIGTSSPATNLEIRNASAPATLKMVQSGAGQFTITTESGLTTLAVPDTGAGLAFGTGTGGTERLRIDSSGSVGIGTTSPNAPLHIQASGTAEFSLWGSSFGRSKFNLQSVDDGTSTGKFQITTESTVPSSPELLTITNAGNVGIGMSSPLALLDIASSVNSTQVRIRNTSTGTASMLFQDSTSGTTTGDGLYVGRSTGVNYLWTYESEPLVLATNNSEAARIDSSGNLLVGMTSVSGSTVGAGVLTSGLIYNTRDGGHALQVNRNTSDGEIAQFRKDGSTVGSIGVTGSGTQPYFVKASTGGFKIGNDVSTALLLPVNADGSNSDGGAQLGTSSNRFKDLYLSGGVYLGGVGSANKLDDFESGSFGLTTASDSTGSLDSSSYGYYIKVGEMVTVQIVFQCTANFSSNRIGNLPFTPTNAITTISSVHGGGVLFYGSSIGAARISNNSSTILFYDTSGNAINPSTSNDPFRFTLTYRTS